MNSPKGKGVILTYAIDPEIVPLMDQVVSFSIADMAAARAISEQLSEALQVDVDESALDIDDQWITGHENSPDVRVRVYRPKNVAERLPALLNIHGGGFVLGKLENDHEASVLLASQLRIVVVSVGYRLAPENPYPAGLNDCYAALSWMSGNSHDLGIDAARIAVLGHSAGGALAAGLTLLSRDLGGPSIQFQFLNIPVLDNRMTSKSMTDFVDTPVWFRSNAEFSWRYYLGELGDDEVPQYAAPARAGNLKDVPPAYISAMEFDPLRDEAILYALALLDAGVPVELHVYPGTYHASEVLLGARVSKRILEERYLVLKKALKVD
jgi:acetyl esterase